MTDLTRTVHAGPSMSALRNTRAKIMHNRCHTIRTALLVLVTFTTAALAQQPATLTLACEGTVTAGDAKPEPISIGIIVNFTAGTVEGFGYPAPIINVDDTTVICQRSANPTIDGNIDRVTGRTKVGTLAMGKDWFLSMLYLLTCKPAQRMF